MFDRPLNEIPNLWKYKRAHHAKNLRILLQYWRGETHADISAPAKLPDFYSLDADNFNTIVAEFCRWEALIHFNQLDLILTEAKIRIAELSSLISLFHQVQYEIDTSDLLLTYKQICLSIGLSPEADTFGLPYQYLDFISVDSFLKLILENLNNPEFIHTYVRNEDWIGKMHAESLLEELRHLLPQFYSQVRSGGVLAINFIQKLHTTFKNNSGEIFSNWDCISTLGTEEFVIELQKMMVLWNERVAYIRDIQGKETNSDYPKIRQAAMNKRFLSQFTLLKYAFNEPNAFLTFNLELDNECRSCRGGQNLTGSHCTLERNIQTDPELIHDYDYLVAFSQVLESEPDYSDKYKIERDEHGNVAAVSVKNHLWISTDLLEKVYRQTTRVWLARMAN